MAEITVPLELRRANATDHTLEGICVPYGRVTFRTEYRQGERFLPGSFSDMTQKPAKVRLTDSHDESGRRPLGVGTEFRDTPDGLWGRFRFYNTPEGRGGWENALEETYGGLSVGFMPLEERTASDGAREISKALLFHVSLVDEPAYEEARVLAVREASPALPDVSALLAVTYNLEDMPEPVDLSRAVW